MSDASAERYRRAKAIAETLLAVDAAARASRLAELCGDDLALRREVDWLLAAAEDDSEDDLPERFQSAARSTLRAVSLEAPMPRNFRLLERLDAGGSGVVYRAERVDGQVVQRVALKLLSPAHADDTALVERFANERQALARLSHPNIAHLIDGGLTAEGRPFLATEYVEGDPIDLWCQHRGPPLQARLRLMIKVCEAVDYAHRHMVIHRDLKPSNILVTAEGEPKLLDFGIARILDRGDGPVQVDGQYMTLDYASPEQLSGRPLNAATDVYSLGVVLHELVTGRRPFDEIEDLEERVRARQVQSLTGIRHDRSPALGGRMGADLEAILLQALATHPEQRYASARELARDLERFLQKRPVQARRGGGLYRCERFVARHRFATALGLLSLILLAGFLFDRERQLQRIAWERDRAEAVTDFMNEVFSGADSLPSRGNAVTVREILDLGSERLATRDAFSPAVLGSIHLALGRAYNALGLGEQALPLLETARAEWGPYTSAGERARVEADIAGALDAAGRAAEAIAADERAIALLQEAGMADSDEALQLRVRKLRNHANMLDVPLEQTVAALEGIADQLARRDGPPGELLFETLAALVASYVFQNRADDALRSAAAAQALAEQLYGDDDPRRLRGRHVYATALMLSEPDRAIEYFMFLVADHERLIGPSQRLANSLGNLGVALARSERNAEAIEAFSRAADMIDELAGRDHYLYRLSVSNRAALHLRQSEPVIAETLIRTLLEPPSAADPVLGVEASYRASALDILGSALALQGRLSEAAAIYQEALALLDDESSVATRALQAGLSQRLAAVERQLSERN